MPFPTRNCVRGLLGANDGHIRSDHILKKVNFNRIEAARLVMCSPVEDLLGAGNAASFVNSVRCAAVPALETVLTRYDDNCR
jgi:hypothetical protein